MTDQGYLLDNRAADASQRFEALAAVFNPWTFQHLDALGLGSGWRCWEVGAGGPTVPAWLAGRVGPGGEVVATDIDVSWMRDDDAYRTLQHDVARDDPPGDRFDVVHTRLVLTHVPERDEGLRRMARALRPGGWLLVEDFDVTLQPLACLDPVADADERANRIRERFLALLVGRGVDVAFGRTLPRRLRSLGLVDVRADAYEPLAVPATPALEQANVQQVREGLTATGLAEGEIDAHLSALAAGGLDIATPPLVSAWGRRP
jgi:SAM-dependent methyltransferase